jgi:hypothetical protein
MYPSVRRYCWIKLDMLRICTLPKFQGLQLPFSRRLIIPEAGSFPRILLPKTVVIQPG